MSDDAERLISALEAALRPGAAHPTELLALADMALRKKLSLRAVAFAQRAMREGAGDPAMVARAKSLLTSLLPGYHVAMMNDARRNAAWDAALRAAIRPGMHVLEIGTGAGMLALMAARAGATKVVTCEKDPVAAALAREIAERNGYADRIEVIGKHSRELEIGIDLERPADLLFCDIFGDKLFDFDPLPALADVRRRLVLPQASSIPVRGALRVALAHWDKYDRASHVGEACGFDLAPFAAYSARALAIDVGDPTIRLMSEPKDIFCFDFSAIAHSAEDRAAIKCRATTTGEVNGIARWIRLELDGKTALEACPDPGAVFFSRLNFCPLPNSLQLRAGADLTVGTAYRGTAVETWLET